MQKKYIIIFIALIIFVSIFSHKVTNLSGLERVDKGNKPKIAWNRFDKGVELAKKENKMLIVDFYTDWCHWCKVMDKETYANSEVVSFTNRKVIMAKINAETDERFKFGEAMYSGRELSMMFGVRGFPSTVFFNSKGELITAISGFIPAERFTCIAKYLADDWYNKIEFDEFAKKECK